MGSRRKRRQAEITALSRRSFLAGTLTAALGACGGDQASSPAPPIAGPTPAPPGPAPAPTPTPAPALPPAGSRILGIVPTDRESDEFAGVIDMLVDSGAHNSHIQLYWDDIETSPGVYDPDPNFAAIANLFYASRGLPLSLAVAGIDTNVDRRPADLLALPYDHPDVIARYKALIDWVMGQMPDLQLTIFSVCNEVNVLLGTDSAAWEAFRGFFDAVAPHIRSLRPGVPVGSKATFSAALNSAERVQYAELVELGDGVFLTYYPFQPDFSVRPLTDVMDDFETMANFPGSKPVHLLECGYPSASLLGSSEQLQADFVSEAFAAWDRYRDRIVQLDYFALHDFDPAVVTTLENYYGIPDPRFGAFLGTLGLRTWPGLGADKIGWARFVAEAQVRGFGN